MGWFGVKPTLSCSLRFLGEDPATSWVVAFAAVNGSLTSLPIACSVENNQLRESTKVSARTGCSCLSNRNQSFT